MFGLNNRIVPDENIFTEPKHTIILQSPGQCKYKCKHRCKQVPDDQLNNTSFIQLLKWDWQKTSPSVLLFQSFCPATFPDGRRRSKVHDGQQVRATLLLPWGRQDHVRGVSARSAHHRWGSFQSDAPHMWSWFMQIMWNHTVPHPSVQPLLSSADHRLTHQINSLLVIWIFNYIFYKYEDTFLMLRLVLNHNLKWVIPVTLHKQFSF